MANPPFLGVSGAISENSLEQERVKYTFETATSRKARKDQRQQAAQGRDMYQEHVKMVADFKARQQEQEQPTADRLSSGGARPELFDDLEHSKRSSRGSWRQDSAFSRSLPVVLGDTVEGPPPFLPAQYNPNVPASRALSHTFWGAGQDILHLQVKVQALKDTISKSRMEAAGFDVQLRVSLLSQACEFLTVSDLVFYTLSSLNLTYRVTSLLIGEQLTELDAISKTSDRQALGVRTGLIDVLVPMLASSFRSDAWSCLPFP